MNRPNFITKQDILRWSNNIDNDKLIPTIFKDHDELREVCYAGMWLDEELKKINCPNSIISKILFTAGKLSFGRDAWDVHIKCLEEFQTSKLIIEDK